MSGSGFAITGVQELQAALDRMVKAAQSTAVEIVNRSETVIEAEVKKQFAGAHSRRTATTSAPGEPPDVVTGTLRRSITAEPAKVAGLGATGRVYPSALYSRIQELGGATGRNHSTVLPARPYMAPALKNVQGELSSIATEEWRKIT